MAFTTAYDWVFDRKLPVSQEARKALAIYREGRNAEQNYLVSYAVLSYFKIIELRNYKMSKVKSWIRDNYAHLKIVDHLSDRIKAFEAACGKETPEEYIYKACRLAVAHANNPSSSDPDDLNELMRLHIAADVMRALARLFIQRELRVSDSFYDGS